MPKLRVLRYALLMALPALVPAGVMGQPPAPVRATLFTNVVSWTTTPGTAVRIVLRSPERVKATVNVTADENGNVTAVFPVGGGGGDTTIRAGDRIGIHPANGEAFTKTVPAMSVSLEHDTRTLSGSAPAFGRLQAAVYDLADQEIYTNLVEVDGAGHYSLVLPEAVQLVQGVYGTMTLALLGGDPWAVRWDVLAAQCTVGSSSISGRATLGTTVRLRLESQGNPKASTGASPTTILRTPNFSLNFREGTATVPVAVGNTVLVEHNGQVALSASAPEVTVVLDADGDQITGTAPPVSTLQVIATSATGDTAAVVTASDTSGHYRADFRGQLDIGPGTTAYTAWSSNRITFRTLGVLQQVVASLYGSQVSGVAPQRASVSANLHDAGGALLASGSANAGSDGTFRLNLTEPGGAAAVRTAPGQRLSVTIGQSAPILLELPDVTATADPDGDRVAGTALPNAQVLVTVSAAGGGTPTTVATTADSSGRYSASFAGRADIQPGSTGTVRVALAGGHAVVLSWAVPQLALTLGSATVTGIGPAGRAVTLSLRRGGAIVGTGSGVVGSGFASATGWTVALAAPGAPGSPAPIEAGDTLEARIADWSGSLLVPNVTVDVDTEADLVSGEAPARHPVRVTAARGNANASLTVEADATGHYEVSFRGRWDLATGDTVSSVVTLEGGHTLTAEGGALELAVDLRTGVVSGRAARNVTVRATLRSSAGSQRATGQAQTGSNGRFEVQLVDTAGQPVAPNEGDILRLEYGTSSVEMTIPRLTVEYDAGQDTVRGEATPGGRVLVRAVGALGGAMSFDAPVTADGRYSLSLAGRFDIRAGTLLQVSYITAEGFTARLDERVPIGHVQVTGNLVNGYAAPNATVSVMLGRGGSMIASGSVTAAADGAFQLRLMTSMLQPQRIQSGDRVTIAWQGGSRTLQAGGSGRIEIAVANIAATIDAARRTVVGMTAPNTPVYLRRSTGGGEVVLPITSDAQGNFSQTMPGGAQSLAAGYAVEAGVLDAEGHRTYLLLVVPYLEATMGTDHVAGQASPLVDMTLRLHEGAAMVGEAQLASTAIGDFEARLQPVGSSQPLVQTGRILSLAEPRSGTTSIEIPELSIELDRPAATIRGTAPANSSLILRLFLPEREPIDRQTRSDANGHWSFTDRDLPRGADYSIADLLRCEARLTVANGHRILAVATPVGPPPTSTPTEPAPTATPTVPQPGGLRLYLPSLLRSQ